MNSVKGLPEREGAGLLNLYYLNSHIPGVTRIAVDRHTSVCGINNTGKSTLQRPVMVFYGEVPSAVVPPSKKSFEAWYLPHDSSYLVFEYVNHAGDRCQAVLTRSPDGGHTEFRILGEPFDFEAYIRSRDGETITLRPSREFFAACRQRTVPLTRQLNATEYRAVIQHNLDAIKGVDESRKELRAYAQQYALVSRRQPLRHAEKLVRLVYTRSGKMTAMREMLAAILQDEEVSVPETRLKKGAVDCWRRACDASARFERLRDTCLGVVDDGERLREMQVILAEVGVGLRADQKGVEARIEELRAHANELREELEAGRLRWESENQASQAGLSKAEADRAEMDGRLNQWAARAAEWDEAGIREVIEQQAQIPSWRAELLSAQRTLEYLEQESQDLRQQHAEHRLQIHADAQAQMDRAGHRLDAARTAFEKASRERDEAREVLAEALASQRRAVEAGNAEEIDALRTQRLEFDAVATHAPLTPDEQAAVVAAQHAVGEQERAWVAARDSLSQATDAVERQRSQCADALEARRQAQAALDQQRRKCAEWRGLLLPEPGTLIEALRRDAPAWGETIGRVIDPSLLPRKDLSPSFAEGDGCLFGLSLDLSRIAVSPAAMEIAELEAHFAQAEAAEREAEHAANAANAEVLSSERQLAALQGSAAAARRAEEAARFELDRLRERRDQVHASAAAAKTARALAAKRQAESLAAAVERARAAHAKAADALRDAERTARTEQAAHWHRRLQPLQEAVDAIIAEQKRVRRAAQEAEAAAERVYQDRLKERGVDDKAVRETRTRIKTIHASIAGVESKADDIARYEAFVAERNHAEPGLLHGLEEATSRVAHWDRELRSSLARWEACREQISVRRKRVDEDERHAKEQRDSVASALRRLALLDLPPASMARGRDVADRIQIERDLCAKHDELRNRLQKGLQDVERALSQSPDSPLGEAWDLACRESEDVDRKGVALWRPEILAAKLGDIVNGLATQFRDGVLSEGRGFGSHLRDVFILFKDVERRIASLSTSISREVDQHLPLAGIEDVQVRLRSRVSDLEFWGDLEAFAAMHDAWKEAGYEGFPSEGYASAMARVAELTSRSAASRGLSSLIDVELRFRENGQPVVVRTDEQFANGASNGMTYLILMKFLLAFTRLLRGKENVRMTWPVDEIGTLAAENVKRVFDACVENGIAVFGAFPDPDYHRLSLFDERYLIKDGCVHSIRPEESALDARLKALRGRKEA